MKCFVCLFDSFLISFTIVNPHFFQFLVCVLIVNAFINLWPITVCTKSCGSPSFICFFGYNAGLIHHILKICPFFLVKKLLFLLEFPFLVCCMSFMKLIYVPEFLLYFPLRMKVWFTYYKRLAFLAN